MDHTPSKQFPPFAVTVMLVADVAGAYEVNAAVASMLLVVVPDVTADAAANISTSVAGTPISTLVQFVAVVVTRDVTPIKNAPSEIKDNDFDASPGSGAKDAVSVLVRSSVVTPLPPSSLNT